MKHRQWLLSAISVLLTFILIFLVAKEVVMPVYGEYEKLKSDYSASVKLQQKTAIELDRVKDIVREELNAQDTNCLYNYIKINTTNLTETTMKAIARAIVKHSWEAKLPLGIMVAVAETRSNFNPTKLTGTLRGIYQVDETNLLDKKIPISGLHTIDSGVKIGCNLMAEKFASSMNWSDALHRFNFQKRSSSFIEKVYKNTANFVAYQHIYDVKLQARLDIKKKLAAEQQQTKEG